MNNDASLQFDSERPAIRLERHLFNSPSVVWQALTERDQLRLWFPCDVVVSGGRWEAGASISFHFPPDVIEMTLHGRVIEVDEPKLLVYTWGDDILRFELHPEDLGTLLVLVDELPSESAARNAAGWDECLDRLAGGSDDVSSWQARFQSYSKKFSSYLGPQEGPPPQHKGIA
jgi:uncharacterized protein YndB with AHSA1/START domain